MELIKGDTLDIWAQGLRSDASWVRMKMVCCGLLDSIEELHSNSIFHRDIKPENVMIRDDISILMDVGVAEITSNDEMTMNTSVKDFVGSLRYASPQFILGEQFQASDDVYGIGATMLELFSGIRPYDEIERKPVLPIEVTRRSPHIGELKEKVPGHIRVLLQGCLHPKGERRPNLDEIREALNSKEATEYIKNELAQRSQDSPEFEIIKIHSASGGFLADIGSENPEFGTEYAVVRRDEEITVPSLNTKTKPEIWVCDTELRHFSNNVGHFKLVCKKWVPSRNRNMFGMMSQGHWGEYDKKDLEVEIGDFVVKRISDD